MKIKTITTALLALSINAAMAQAKACDPAKERNFKSLSAPNKAGGYGEIITKDGAMPLASIEAKMKESKLTLMPNVKITGKVADVCKKKGCWMEVDNGKGEMVRMRFKDYAFFVPRDCEGQIVYASGTAKLDTTTVAMLQHYAEDAGKSKAEIAAINKEEVAVTFEATGVLFDKK